MVDLHRTGQESASDLAGLFGVARSTVHRALERARHHRHGCHRQRSHQPGQVALSEPGQIPLPITRCDCRVGDRPTSKEAGQTLMRVNFSAHLAELSDG